MPHPLRLAVALGLMVTAVVAAPAASARANCEQFGSPAPRNVGSSDNFFSAVAATSPCNAWAVGGYTNGGTEQTLVERWNGTTWIVQLSPDVGGSANGLVGIAATSSKNAWAVGNYFNGTTTQTLIEHWNGATWSTQSSPDVGGSATDNLLSGVTAISPSDAWAVGFYITAGAQHTLVEHWNGTSWKVQPSPNRGGSATSNLLASVAASSSKDA